MESPVGTASLNSRLVSIARDHVAALFRCPLRSERSPVLPVSIEGIGLTGACANLEM